MPPLHRRHLLKAAGVALALPTLEAMKPSAVRAGFASDPAPPRRMMCICTNMGMMPEFFWPQVDDLDDDGAYRPSEYLALIDDFREHYTVFSGVSHPEVDGGHNAEISYLTAAPHPAAGGFKNTISLDQYAAEWIGIRTRFPYLALNVGVENSTLSWTGSGVRVPAEDRPSKVFQKLFVQGNEAEVENQVRRLRDGRSILDLVGDRAGRLHKKVGRNDRQKLDQYYQSVRELEQRLVTAEQWQRKPK